MFVYDMNKNSWNDGTPMPTVLHHSGAAIPNEKFYLIGGGIFPGGTYSPIIERYYNTVIPEFGAVAVIVLGIAIISIIIFSARSRLCILPRQ